MQEETKSTQAGGGLKALDRFWDQKSHPTKPRVDVTVNPLHIDYGGTAAPVAPVTLRSLSHLRQLHAQAQMGWSCSGPGRPQSPPTLPLDLLLPEEEEEEDASAAGLASAAGDHQQEEPYAVWQLQPDALSPASVKGAPTKVKASTIATAASSCSPRLPTALAQPPSADCTADDSDSDSQSGGAGSIVKQCRSPQEAETLLHKALNMSSWTLRAGGYVVAAATTQGGRSYQEDCHFLHTLTTRLASGDTMQGRTPPMTPRTPAAQERIGHSQSCDGSTDPAAEAAFEQPGSFTEPPSKMPRLDYSSPPPSPLPSPSPASSAVASLIARDMQHLSVDYFARYSMDGEQEGPQPDAPVITPGEELLCCGVLDGHGGAETARFAAHHLAEYLALALAASTRDGPLSSGNSVPALSAQHVRPACHTAFLSLDAALAMPEHTQELYRLARPEITPAAAAAAAAAAVPAAALLPCAVAHADMLAGSEAQGQKQAGVAEDGSSADGDMETSSSNSESVPYWYGRWGDDEAAPYIGPSAGSTAAVAVLGEQLLAVAGVGDSCALLGQSSSEWKVLTVSHKPTDEAEQARIVQAGGWVSRSGRVNSDLDMSRSLGDCEFKQAKDLPADAQAVIAVPDVSIVDLRTESHDHPFQYLLLASDGLTNSITNEEIHAFVTAQLHQEGVTPELICRRLAALSCVAESTAYDNTTVMLLVPSS